MKILIKQEAVSGEVPIAPGEYMASVKTDTSQIKLVGRGIDITIPAMRRPSKSKSKIPTVTFYSMGGPTWTLVITAPPTGEYFAFITYDAQKK